MAQKLRDDKIGTLSHSGGAITLTASSSSPSWLTIGGQQYKATSSLSRTIATDLAMTANTLYMIYAVRNGGNTELRISANVNSVGPSGFASWKLIGAFYSNGLLTVAFGSFINIEGSPKTETRIQYLGNIADGTNTQVASGTPLTNQYFWERDGRYGLYWGAYYHQAVVGIAGTGAYFVKVPSQQVIIQDGIGGGNSGSGGGIFNGDVGGGVFATGTKAGEVGNPVNGFQARLTGDTDGGNWGQTGSGGVFDAFSLNNTFVGMAWSRVPCLISTFSITPLKDL